MTRHLDTTATSVSPLELFPCKHSWLWLKGAGLSQARVRVRMPGPQEVLHGDNALQVPQWPLHGCFSCILNSGGHCSRSRWAFVQDLSLVSRFLAKSQDDQEVHEVQDETIG